MNKLYRTWPLMITASTLLAVPASAQTAFKLQPGLWEQSMTMKTASGRSEPRRVGKQSPCGSLSGWQPFPSNTKF
jgi:hypothetical protein